MTAAPAALASAAEEFIGVPFHLGGRDPRSGVDCIGLVVATLEKAGIPVGCLPAYGLRQHEITSFIRLARRLGLRPSLATSRPGDILLLRPGPAQSHLAIMGWKGAIIHAHAGLRRVVQTPAPLPWPIEQSWRLA